MVGAGFGRIAVAALSVAVAAYAVAVYATQPVGAFVHPEMRASFAANPPAVYAHVFGAAVALALGPWQFSARLRRRRPRVHRWMGRAYLALGVGVGGIAGLVLAPQAFGGGAARLGFAALALAWLASGMRAYAAIRAGDVAAHRRWMLRNFALAFAAVTLRLYLPAAVAAGLPFAPAYAAIAWLCWVPNLLVAEWLVGRGAGTASRAPA
jgi:uncharacterized membrane protein